MNSLLDNLTVSLNSNNAENVKENLRAIITHHEDVKLSDANAIHLLFNQKSNEIVTLTCEAIAQIAKNETNRKVLTRKDVVDFLLGLFGNEVEESIIQVCRALGNICYDNPEAREIVGKNGLKVVFDSLQREKMWRRSDVASVACGLMLNLLMDNDELQKEVLALKFLDFAEMVLAEMVKNLEKNESCCFHLLTILNILTEHLGEEWLSKDLCASIVDVLKICTISEISVTCLEIIHGQLECDDTKIFLARKGVCELIYQLVEKHKGEVKDEDSRAVLKMACDVIVLILTGDESMNYLYSDGKGSSYKNMLVWLNCEDYDLLSTSILALGNFARNDNHCIQMVQNGIAKSLLNLLSKHNTTEKDAKLQYAILSALRNLVILPQNKTPILSQGLIEILYPMLNSEHSHVVFKLLGTLRIAIDGQQKEAYDLIGKRDLLEKIVFWCCNSDHIGVRGEASRLLAWLIKFCQSTKPFGAILEIDGCVKCLVEMLSSNYAVMQNEAIYALNLLCVDSLSKSDQVLVKSLIAADVGKHLNFLIDKYKDTMTRESLVNYLSLLERLIKSPALVQHLKANNLDETMRTLKDDAKFAAENNKIDELSAKLNSIAL